MGTLLVRHDPASAALVRREVAADLVVHGLTRTSIDDVVLVTSELVSNAVSHSDNAGDLDVGWELEGGTVLVRVGDSSSELPRLRHVDPEAPSGRGMAIVAAIAREWGVERLVRGKQVWARVAVQLAV